MNEAETRAERIDQSLRLDCVKILNLYRKNYVILFIAISSD
jgi:hypothetical protein